MLLEHLAEFGPLAFVALTASLGVQYALGHSKRRLDRLHPEARWRVAFLAAFLPFLSIALFVAGASSDWLLRGPAPFCLLPSRPGEISWSMGLIACFGLAAVSWRILVVFRDLFQSWRTSRALARSSRPAGAFREIPSAAPIAFVAGLWRPQVYVSAALRESLPDADLAVVLAHEQSHRRRRDPLRRTLANAALCFHFPKTANAIAMLLGESQELVADRAAVRSVGDPMHVAQALVRCGKLQWSAAQGFAGFSGASLERRLHELVAGQASLARPTPAELLGILALLALSGTLGGRALHFAWQLLLRLP